jgi:histone H3
MPRIRHTSKISKNPSFAIAAKVEPVHPARKPHRYRSGTKALMTIRKLSKTTQLLIPKSVFGRLVKEIGMKYKSEIRWKRSAIEALHSMAEAYLVDLFQKGGAVSVVHKQQTLMLPDFKMAQCMRDSFYEIRELLLGKAPPLPLPSKVDVHKEKKAAKQTADEKGEEPVVDGNTASATQA